MSYENYPVRIPLLSVIISLTIYIAGARLLFVFGWVPVLFYLLFCCWFEYRIIKMSCSYCYYYGKLCGTGKGIIAPFLTRKGDPKVFIEKAIGWTDLIPDMLVFLIPVAAGILHLFVRFDIFDLSLIILLFVLAMPCTGLMRSCMLCANCKQKVLGCPAEKLFGKKAK